MQDAIKYILDPMFEAILQEKMDFQLGYGSNDHGPKNTKNRRNGYSSKALKSTYGEIPLDVSRDRDTSFGSRSIPKCTRNVSGIEVFMYARGLSQHDIARTDEDIYGFEISHETISTITDRVTETAGNVRTVHLRGLYVSVCRLYASVRKDMETRRCDI